MMEKARLGTHGPMGGRMGYGAMVLEGYYGASDDAAAVATLVHAMQAGMLIDTADAYGDGHNERLIAAAIRKSAATPFVATKFGIVFDDTQPATQVPTGWGFSLNINGRPEYVREALEGSLTRLEVDVIDLWYAHYLDTRVPVEETVKGFKEIIEGKHDDLPEGAFYMVGGIEEAQEKAERIAAASK